MKGQHFLLRNFINAATVQSLLLFSLSSQVKKFVVVIKAVVMHCSLILHILLNHVFSVDGSYFKSFNFATAV